jgi:hypothetical protein
VWGKSVQGTSRNTIRTMESKKKCGEKVSKVRAPQNNTNIQRILCHEKF